MRDCAQAIVRINQAQLWTRSIAIDDRMRPLPDSQYGMCPLHGILRSQVHLDRLNAVPPDYLQHPIYGPQVSGIK